jgi:hypothetical protein
MNSRAAHLPSTSASDEAAIRAFPQQLVDAWNRGSGEAFAAPFTESADFIAFEGTHLKGRQQIAVFHQQIFDTVVKGRDSMQLFVATKRDGRWYVEAVLNARKLTLERQAFFDDVDALPAEAQGQVSNLIAALRQRHPG